MISEKIIPMFEGRMDNNNTIKFNTEIYDQIMRFLREHKRRSKNTAQAYERDIRHFFKITRKKEIEHLIREDLIFTIEEFEDYQAYLLDKLNMSTNTSNRRITSVSECMRHLHQRGFIEDITFLNIKRPKIIPKSYDGLTFEEVKRAADFVGTQGREFTAKNKRALILFAFDTCMRLEECLNLKWSDFGEIGNDNMIPINTIGKGNKIIKRKIDLHLYNELKQIKKEGSDKVFHISNSTVDRMMGQIREFLKIDPNKRNITFHSIRKAGAQWIWETTRDLNQVRKSLGHESIKTTELYINKDEDYGVVGAISSMYRTDKDLYKKVSHKDLIKAIDKLGIDKKLVINLKLKEIIDSY